MQAENFITIQGWMRTELNLKGNELLVYAIIYGFSQTENQAFTGSLQYLADWCGATKQGIMKNLKSLLDKGLITKSEFYENGVKYCEYKGVLNSVAYPIKLSLTNKKEDNIDITNKTISKDIVENFSFGSKENKTKKATLYDKCISMIAEFTDDHILRALLIASLKLFLDNSRESNVPFYSNHFKGKLNTLKKLSDDNYEQRKIVQQTLDNGWNNFYELKTNTRRSKTGDFSKDVEMLTGGLNKRAEKGGVHSGKKY